MDRFDKFLNNYLIKYLENELISEIIITDENGSDIAKINKKFHNNAKLKLYKNETVLGPFLNKIKACSLANNEWIVLMDSDNFADTNYFNVAKKYIENNIKAEKNIILAPFKANPNFNFSHLSGLIYKKDNFAKNLQKEKSNAQAHNTNSETLMNTGNYVINKFLIQNLNLQNEKENIYKSSACDVIYFNTLLFEQLDLHMHIVENLEYEHVVHDGSIYLKTSNKYANFNNEAHKRFRKLV
jgi:hypothetical protein